MISKTYSCSELEFYTKFFEILNIVQSNPDNKLTKSEIQILSHFLLIEGTFKELKFKTKEQLIVKDKLQITLQNVRTIITNLKNKNYIQVTDEIHYLHPGIEAYFKKALESKNFTIAINFKIENE